MCRCLRVWVAVRFLNNIPKPFSLDAICWQGQILVLFCFGGVCVFEVQHNLVWYRITIMRAPNEDRTHNANNGCDILASHCSLTDTLLSFQSRPLIFRWLVQFGDITIFMTHQRDWAQNRWHMTCYPLYHSNCSICYIVWISAINQ